MAIPASSEPIWYGPERTQSALHHLGVHRVLRHNRIPPHRLPCAELAAVVSGSLHLLSGASDVTLRGGEFAIVPAHTSFHSGPGPNRCLVYWIGIGSGWRADASDLSSDEGRALDGLMAQHALRTLPMDPPFAAAIAAAFAAVHAEDDPFTRRGSALLLLGHLRRVLTTQGGDRNLALAAVQPAIDLIAARLDRPPLIAELARACALGRSAFCETFRSATGRTPADYLLDRRLTRAADLLGQPGATVADIARGLGFSTPQYFATAFRRLHGCTPSAWAAQHGAARAE